MLATAKNPSNVLKPPPMVNWPVGFSFTRIAVDAKDARQDTDDIAVEDWRGLVERNAENRARRVAPNARKRENVVELLWKNSVAAEVTRRTI